MIDDDDGVTEEAAMAVVVAVAEMAVFGMAEAGTKGRRRVRPVRNCPDIMRASVIPTPLAS